MTTMKLLLMLSSELSGKPYWLWELMSKLKWKSHQRNGLKWNDLMSDWSK